MSGNAKLKHCLNDWFSMATVEPNLDLHRLFMQAVLPHLETDSAGDLDFDLKLWHYELSTIRDWIGMSVRNLESWVEDADCGPITAPRLDTFSSLSHVFETAVAEIKDITERLRSIYIDYDDARDIGTMLDLENGFQIVHVRTPNAVRREGAFMRNCMVHGEYDRTIYESGRYIYSLRDRKNRPHATMDVQNGLVLQCKGKQDAPVIKDYFPYIRRFFQLNNLRLIGKIPQVGMVFQGGTYHSIYDLPEDVSFTGDLDLNTITMPVTFPKGSCIEKELIINGNGPAVDFSLCAVKTVRFQYRDREKRLHCDNSAAEILIDKESNLALEQNRYRHGRPIPSPSCIAAAAHAPERNP